jgi:hypothetical protein
MSYKNDFFVTRAHPSFFVPPGGLFSQPSAPVAICGGWHRYGALAAHRCRAERDFNADEDVHLAGCAPPDMNLTHERPNGTTASAAAGRRYRGPRLLPRLLLLPPPVAARPRPLQANETIRCGLGWWTIHPRGLGARQRTFCKGGACPCGLCRWTGRLCGSTRCGRERKRGVEIATRDTDSLLKQPIAATRDGCTNVRSRLGQHGAGWCDGKKRVAGQSQISGLSRLLEVAFRGPCLP